mgnify:CR=1 FL=1
MYKCKKVQENHTILFPWKWSNGFTILKKQRICENTEILTDYFLPMFSDLLVKSVKIVSIRLDVFLYIVCWMTGSTQKTVTKTHVSKYKECKSL